ncbi:unnamed protein product, partial [Owenia fusiformis]
RWGSWGRWKAGECSKQCGSGLSRRTRIRKKLPASYGTCTGSNVQTETVICNTKSCTVQGGCPQRSNRRYGFYPPWCCVNGIWHQPYQNHLYKCEKISDGIEITKSCPNGETFKIFSWNSCCCVKDGEGACCKWGEWGQWQYQRCSTTCGSGKRYKSRTRTGGPGCLGDSIETELIDCDLPPCPVGCKWSEFGPWSTYSSCTVTCGSGTIVKRRTRTKQQVPYGGSRYCIGKSYEDRTFTCSNPSRYGCKWSAWTPWQYRQCSTSCGSGRRYKSRTRSKLKVQGGSGCPGASIETGYMNCDNPPCGCRYNGRFYAEGSSFPSSDGCNTCTCRRGNVGCTEKLC